MIVVRGMRATHTIRRREREDKMKNKELKGYMSYANGEIELSKWIINKDTLGYSGWRGS